MKRVLKSTLAGLLFTTAVVLSNHASAEMTIDDGFGSHGQADSVNANPLVAPLYLNKRKKLVGKSPFAQACLDWKSREATIETGLFNREVPLTDTAGRSARDFLNHIAGLVATKIKINRETLDGFKDCLGPNPKNPKCPILQEFVDTHLKSLVQQARTHLALAQTEFQLSSIAHSARPDLNIQLDPLSTYKKTPWKALNVDEKTHAQKILSEYVAEINGEIQKEVAAGDLPKPRPWIVRGKEEFFDAPETIKFRNDALLAVRLGHGASYRALIAEFPIIQYLANETTTRAEVLAAAREMRQQLDEESTLLIKTVKAINRTETAGGGAHSPLTSIDPEALQILDYRRLVELWLLDEPQDCSVAAGLMLTRNNRELGNNIAIALPILASGFVLAPIISIPLGIVAGVGFTYDSHEQLKHAERQYLSQVKAVEMAGELAEVESATSNYRFNLWTMPLAFAGSQVVTKKIGLNFGAAILASKISRAAPKIKDHFSESKLLRSFLEPRATK